MGAYVWRVMKTAKEIAAALSVVPFLGNPSAVDLGVNSAPLRDLFLRMEAREIAGEPTALENFVLTKWNEAVRLLGSCRAQAQYHIERQQHMVNSLAKAAGAVPNGLGWTPSDNLSCMNSEEPMVKLTEARLAVEAFAEALKLFAAIGDNVAATPEERAEASAERSRLARKAQLKAWAWLPLKRLRDEAKTAGLSNGGTREDLAERLVDAGLVAPKQEAT